MNKIKYQNYGPQKNWVHGKYEQSSSDKTISVISPYFGKEIATVPDSNSSDLEQAVEKAKQQVSKWSRLNIRDRAEVMFRFKTILENNIDELAQLIALDNGKTIEDAKGSIMRGKEVVEFATSLPSVLNGDSSQVADGITCTMTYEPLGIVAGITPAFLTRVSAFMAVIKLSGEGIPCVIIVLSRATIGTFSF